MTRRDYDNIASVLKDSRAIRSPIPQETKDKLIDEIVRRMGSVFNTYNTNFQANRFREACRGEPDPLGGSPANIVLDPDAMRPARDFIIRCPECRSTEVSRLTAEGHVFNCHECRLNFTEATPLINPPETNPPF